MADSNLDSGGATTQARGYPNEILLNTFSSALAGLSNRGDNCLSLSEVTKLIAGFSSIGGLLPLEIRRRVDIMSLTINYSSADPPLRLDPVFDTLVRNNLVAPTQRYLFGPPTLSITADRCYPLTSPQLDGTLHYEFLFDHHKMNAMAGAMAQLRSQLRNVRIRYNDVVATMPHTSYFVALEQFLRDLPGTTVQGLPDPVYAANLSRIFASSTAMPTQRIFYNGSLCSYGRRCQSIHSNHGVADIVYHETLSMLADVTMLWATAPGVLPVDLPRRRMLLLLKCTLASFAMDWRTRSCGRNSFTSINQFYATYFQLVQLGELSLAYPGLDAADRYFMHCRCAVMHFHFYRIHEMNETAWGAPPLSMLKRSYEEIYCAAAMPNDKGWALRLREACEAKARARLKGFFPPEMIAFEAPTGYMGYGPHDRFDSWEEQRPGCMDGVAELQMRHR